MSLLYYFYCLTCVYTYLWRVFKTYFWLASYLDWCATLTLLFQLYSDCHFKRCSYFTLYLSLLFVLHIHYLLWCLPATYLLLTLSFDIYNLYICFFNFYLRKTLKNLYLYLSKFDTLIIKVKNISAHVVLVMHWFICGVIQIK